MATKQLPRTLTEAVRHFADPANCDTFMVAMRWPDGVACPRCGSKEVTYLENARVWKCRGQHKAQKFSVKVGTVMEDSPISLSKWLPAIWLIVNCKNGVSSYEVHRALGVTQKTAWFMLQRIRLAMQDDRDGGKLGGPGKVVECDESWIGAKARMMNKRQRAKTATEHAGKPGPYSYSGKAIVAGMLERGGRVRVAVVPNVRGATLRPLIRANVARGTALHTDEHDAYASVTQPTGLPAEGHTSGDYPVDYIHEAVNHQAGEHVRGNVHTNNLENFWSLLKRGIRGTYVSFEPFHLFRYLDEQAFRFNLRKHTDGDRGRFTTALRQIVGRRLTYKQLIGLDGAAVQPS